MNNSEVRIDGLWKRPTFSYRGADLTHPAVASQMIESNRNVCETICAELRETNELLRRIDRRMARTFPLRRRTK